MHAEQLKVLRALRLPEADALLARFGHGWFH